MGGQRLPPGVQDREAADLGAEPFGIGGQRRHGLDRALEQDAIDPGLVLKGDGGDRRRQREHDMEIGDRQQLGLSVRQPLRPRRALTLRAMPIAAGVVGDPRRPTILAGFDMTPERGRPTRRDRAHDAPLGPPHMSGVAAKIGLAMAAQDVRDFYRRPAEGSSGAGHDPRCAPLSRRHDLQRQTIERARRRPDRMDGDLRIERRRRQMGMPEQNLNDSNVGTAFQQMRRKAVAQRV